MIDGWVLLGTGDARGIIHERRFGNAWRKQAVEDEGERGRNLPIVCALVFLFSSFFAVILGVCMYTTDGQKAPKMKTTFLFMSRLVLSVQTWLSWCNNHHTHIYNSLHALQEDAYFLWSIAGVGFREELVRNCLRCRYMRFECAATVVHAILQSGHLAAPLHHSIVSWWFMPT